MPLNILGEPPLAKDGNGKLKSRVATIFPFANTIVTLPGIHATQRLAYLDWLHRQRQALGMTPLSREEEAGEWQNSVDLIMEDDAVLIRPDPDNMGLAFRADELLQQLVPKHRVRFLLVRNEKVRTAIKQRGECWRISPLPKTPDEMRQMIAASKIAIRGGELYYYSKATGTRFLTYEDFAQLGGAGGARPAAAPGGNPRILRRHQSPGAAGSGLLHGGQRLRQGRFRPLRLCRAGCGHARGRPRRPAAEVPRRRRGRVPPRRLESTGMAEPDVRRADGRRRENGLRRIAPGTRAPSSSCRSSGCRAGASRKAS